MHRLLKFSLAFYYLTFFAPFSWAGTYFSSADAYEGLRIGIGTDRAYHFVQALGKVDLTYADGETPTFNGILSNPDTLVCVKHPFKKEVTRGTIVFYHDYERVAALVQDAKDKGKDPLSVVLEEGTSPLTIKDVVSELDLVTLELHPTLDLAKIKLRWPLGKVPILPLSLAPLPSIPLECYVVSYSDVSTRTGEELVKNKRHISKIRVGSFISSDSFWKDYLCTKLSETAEGVLEPEGGIHELFALTKPGDSGALLVTSEGEALGLHYGQFSASEGYMVLAFTSLRALPLWIG